MNHPALTGWIFGCIDFLRRRCEGLGWPPPGPHLSFSWSRRSGSPFLYTVAAAAVVAGAGAESDLTKPLGGATSTPSSTSSEVYPTPSQIADGRKSSAYRSGDGVVPVFEGWYRNPDGTFTLQFGYYSRRTEGAVDIPLGPDNRLTPTRFQGAQPTHFLPRPGDRGPGRGIRHWGVFTVTVPPDFGDREVVWTLREGGQSYSIPGHTRNAAYELDHPETAPSHQRFPVLQFEPDGAEGVGPRGVLRELPILTKPGIETELVASAWHGGASTAAVRWFKHQGSGGVTFTQRFVRVDETTRSGSTSAVFHEPGRYVLRARATNAATEFDRYCCWTNGYLVVLVADENERPGALPPSVPSLDGHSHPVDPSLDGSRSHDHHEVSPERRPGQRAEGARARTGSEASVAAGDGDTGTHWELGEKLGPPDLVLESEGFSVPAHGQDQWRSSATVTGLGERRWVRAVEVNVSRPFGARSVHHVVASLSWDGGRSLLTEWAPGKVGEVMPPNTGRSLPAGARVEWDVHYLPVGEAALDDRVTLGVWLYPDGSQPEYRSELRTFRVEPTGRAARGAHLDIPPGEVRKIRGERELSSPVRIESFQPHMHRRGRAMRMEAVLPDRVEPILLGSVDDFDHTRSAYRRFGDDGMPVLPSGTRLVFTARHDNTVENLRNPDPKQWVGFGRRSVDEMAHAWVSVTILTQAQYDDIIKERSAKIRESDGFPLTESAEGPER